MSARPYIHRAATPVDGIGLSDGHCWAPGDRNASPEGRVDRLPLRDGKMLTLRDLSLGAPVPVPGCLEVALGEGPGLPRKPVHSTSVAYDMPDGVTLCLDRHARTLVHM